MRRLRACIAVLAILFLVGCPGLGNLKHGHVPPGQVKLKIK